MCPLSSHEGASMGGSRPASEAVESALPENLPRSRERLRGGVVPLLGMTEGCDRDMEAAAARLREAGQG